MADLIDHIKQAKHNAACAAKLLGEKVYRDWAITATFYAAIHFAEAGFAATDVGHSENKGSQAESPHDVREELIRDNFGNVCWRSYRKLREASRNVRYLPNWQTKTGTALDYYQHADAERFLNTELPRIKEEIQKTTSVNLT